jgi:hypothetical protein
MENNNIIIIVIFIATIIIIGLIIWIIYSLLPKQTTGLFGTCTHQIECSTGLICSKNANNDKLVCLGGIEQSCENNTDCGFNLICNDKKVCESAVTATVNNLNNGNALTMNMDPVITFNVNQPRKITPITSLNQLR